MIRQRKQSGMILILSLLVIGAVLGVVVIFSNLIINEIQQSRLIDQSIQAFYLAESGAERALHQTRRREAVKFADCGLIEPGSDCNDSGAYYGSCSGTNGELTCITTDENTLDVPGRWDVDVKNEESVTIALGIGDSFQMDLFSPYQGGDFNLFKPNGDPTILRSFVVESSVDDVGLFGELTNLTWLIGGSDACPNNYIPPKQSTSRGFVEVPEGSFTSSYITGFTQEEPINPNCSYVLRLTNNLSNQQKAGVFTISIHDDTSGDPNVSRILIPSRLVIQSEARFGSSLQRVQVRTPIRPPLSGLYDFVLFSEQEIQK